MLDGLLCVDWFLLSDGQDEFFQIFTREGISNSSLWVINLCSPPSIPITNRVRAIFAAAGLYQSDIKSNDTAFIVVSDRLEIVRSPNSMVKNTFFI